MVYTCLADTLFSDNVTDLSSNTVSFCICETRVQCMQCWFLLVQLSVLGCNWLQVIVMCGR